MHIIKENQAVPTDVFMAIQRRSLHHQVFLFYFIVGFKFRRRSFKADDPVIDYTCCSLMKTDTMISTKIKK